MVVQRHANCRLHFGHCSTAFGGSLKLSQARPVCASKSCSASKLAEYSRELLSMDDSMAAQGSPALQNFILPCRIESSRKSRGFSIYECHTIITSNEVSAMANALNLGPYPEGADYPW